MEFDFRGFQDRRVRPQDVPWDRILVAVPLILIVLIVLYLTWASVYKVLEYERAVVMRFGKYHATVEPGLQFCFPLVDEVLKVSTEEQRIRLPFGEGSEQPAGVPEEATLMLTGDLNAAKVFWTLQWKVDEPKDFLFRFYAENDPDFLYPQQVIRTVAMTVMNQLVGDYSIDEVLTEKREEIAQDACEETQDILDSYNCGVRIRALQMQRVTPPDKVAPAFDGVNEAIQKRDKLLNEANAERYKLLPAAEAEKDRMIQEANGYAERQLAEANGEVEALLARYRAYQKAPDVTRQRLYIEAMEKVFGQVKSKLIIDKDLQGKMLPLLPLEQGPGQ